MKNRGADQTAWMHRLICAFVVCIQNRFSHDMAHVIPDVAKISIIRLHEAFPTVLSMHNKNISFEIDG